jgi:anti-sigma-K factor RskA
MKQQVQEHEQVMELIPAYAIDAVDRDERVLVDAHLPACVECRALLADYQALGGDLLFAAPVALAPVGSTEKLRKQLGKQREPPQAASWLAFLRRPGFALGIAALALLVLTNVYWAGRVGRLESQADQLAAIARAPGIALRASDATGTGYETSATNGVVYVQPGSNVALLCVYSMPSLEAGKTYQAWLVRDGQRISAGTFGVSRDGYGVLLIDAGKPVTEFQQLGITIEPSGGSPAPTTPRVMGGEL